jgi:hypothetical protein
MLFVRFVINLIYICSCQRKETWFHKAFFISQEPLAPGIIKLSHYIVLQQSGQQLRVYVSETQGRFLIKQSGLVNPC